MTDDKIAEIFQSHRVVKVTPETAAANWFQQRGAANVSEHACSKCGGHCREGDCNGLMLETNDSPASSILAEADRIAGADRSRDYGHPYDNHLRIAQIWNAILTGNLCRDLTPRDVALMMCGLKIAREAHTPKTDNLIDLCGYVKCIELIDQRTKQLNELKQRLNEAIDE